jgi:succinate dehydrogenase / fumarate reductase iron-sulfur subunit
MGNMPVIKDLVTDMASFWSKVKAVEPYLQPAGPPPEREYLVSPGDTHDLTQVMACIMCGACVSDCATLETELSMGKDPERTFLAPAALAKAYRFVADPRDGAADQRLVALSRAEGIWDCTRCNICVEVCPKGVAPMDQILVLRRKAIEAGIEENLGARHTLEFEKSVREASWL